MLCNMNMKVYVALWCNWGMSEEAKYAEIGLRECVGSYELAVCNVICTVS